MARKPKDVQALPELNEIESEMSQVRSKGRFRQSLKGTFGALVVVVAIAVIIAFIRQARLKKAMSARSISTTSSCSGGSLPRKGTSLRSTSTDMSR